MLQSFAASTISVRLDSTHFIAEMIGRPRASVMTAPPLSSGTPQHRPYRGLALARFLRFQRAGVPKAADTKIRAAGRKIAGDAKGEVCSQNSENLGIRHHENVPTLFAGEKLKCQSCVRAPSQP
jgi:hypothetical protein